MTQTVITVKNLSKSFGNVRAVRNLSFSVEAGRCFGFLGPNGAGKTTAMKMIYGKCLRDKNGDTRMDIFGYDPAKNELAIKYLSGVVQQEDKLSTEELGTRLADLRRTLKRVSKEAGQAVPEAQAAQVQMLLSEIEPEAQAAQTPASLSEATMPEEEEPEVDEWHTSSRNRYHWS